MTVTVALAGPVLATREGTRKKLRAALDAIAAGQFVLLDFSAVEAMTDGSCDEIVKSLPPFRWQPVGLNADNVETYAAVVIRRTPNPAFPAPLAAGCPDSSPVSAASRVNRSDGA